MKLWEYLDPKLTPLDAARLFGRDYFTNEVRMPDPLSFTGTWFQKDFVSTFRFYESGTAYVLRCTLAGLWTVHRLTLGDGYAFTSTRRRPRDPATIVIGSEERIGSTFVGTAKIDGAPCAAFRRNKTYYFQTLASLGAVDLDRIESLRA